MTNNKDPRNDRRNNLPVSDYQNWVIGYLSQNNYLTSSTLPKNLSSYTNDVPYMSIAPVVSVNGITGAVVLSLFSGNYLDLINKPSIPTVRRMETFLGVTDTSGNYSVVYSTAYPATPHISPVLVSATPTQVVRITSSTATGFTVNVTNRASVTLLSIDILLSATTPMVGAPVSVAVLSRS